MSPVTPVKTILATYIINKRTYTNKAKLKTKNNVLNEFAIGWSFRIYPEYQMDI